jgi:hypothetical protein
MVFHALLFCGSDDRAVKPAVTALGDRSRIVRHRACTLLACSLRPDAISNLRKILDYSDAATVADSGAAIDAIEHRNHHYFVDRDHSGKVALNFGSSAA